MPPATRFSLIASFLTFLKFCTMQIAKSCTKKYLAQGRLVKPSSVHFHVGCIVQLKGRRCEIMWHSFHKQSVFKTCDIFTCCLYDLRIDAFYFTNKKHSHQSNTRLCLMHYSSKQNCNRQECLDRLATDNGSCCHSICICTVLINIQSSVYTPD